MIETPIGRIEILIDGKNLNYSEVELVNRHKSFIVDKRYQISVDDMMESIIDCTLVGRKTENQAIVETGEDLALISFYEDNLKLSIGAEGDVEGIKYTYLENGIQMEVNKECMKNQLLIKVAWIEMTNLEQEDIYCWFAADPSIR